MGRIGNFDATEIAAILIRDGHIVDQYQSLMNACRRIASFIEHLTGISNAMVHVAPPASQVIAAVADFVGDYPLVAHNALFDRKFRDAELARIVRRTPKALPARCWSPVASCPKHPITSSVLWSSTQGCRSPAAITGHRQMRRWRPI
ncbi:3'-5' exonuclease [Thiocapsa sp.]|uniref:3'-5' exonuclease n=1 Tax=Thiocapsa sp. TaxID=2024551 RepID=UPI0025CF3FC3|nr:3'-5' exonuclease [Thiocapsa sp.]